MLKIPTTYTLTAEELSNMLTGEFEGNFMAFWIESAKSSGWTRPEGHDLPWYCDLAFLASPEFAFIVEYENPEGEGTVTKKITRDNITAGLTFMASNYPQHWADVIGDNADAVTYDVAMQCIVLGEIVYG